MADDEGQLGDVQQQQQPELRERRPRANAPPRWPSESDSEEAPAARESDDDFVMSDEEDPDEEDEEAAEDADQMDGDSDASLGSSDYDGAPGYHSRRSRRSKKKAKKENLPPRPETAMIRKLRSSGPTPEELERARMQEEQARLKAMRPKGKAAAAPAATGGPHASGQDGGDADGAGVAEEGNADDDAESEEEEESSEPEPEAEVYEEPKREVTAEQAAADLVTVHGMWQFASVVEFLFRFRYHLQLDTMITIDSLADAIVTSPGE